MTYTATASGISTSKDFTLNLNADKVTFEWETNSKQIIPTQVNPSTATEQSVIVFPYPFIYKGDEDPINDTNSDGLPEEIAGLTVTLRKGTETLTLSKGADPAETNTYGYYYYIVPTNAPLVEYTVAYSYAAGYAYTIKKEFNFNVVSASDYNQKEDVELKLTLDSSISTAWEIGVEVTFPTITVTNSKKSDAKVAVYTEYLLTCIPSDGSANISYTVTNHKFIPLVVGEYKIQYRVTDFGGNSKTVQHTTNSKATNTSTGMKVYVVGGYEETDAEDMTTAALDNSLDTAEYMIPTKIAKAEDATGIITLPAIFAVDTTESGLDTFDVLKDKFLRSITSPSRVTKFQSTSANSNEIVTEPWEEVEYAFTEVGTYTILYQVVDSAGNVIPLGRYYVTVEEGYEDNTAPEVSVSGLSKVAKAGDTISFSVVAADYLPDSTEVADERIKVEVTVAVGEDSPIILTKNTDGKYEYTIPADTAMGTTVSVNAKATDYAGNYTDAPYTITVSNYSGDNEAPFGGVFTLDPEWISSGVNFVDFYHGDEIFLPEITFSDDSDNLAVNVDIYCDGVKVNTFGKSSWKAKELKMGGEKVTLTHSGKYMVVYEAIDANGNSTIQSLHFNVISKVIPSIAGSIAEKVEYGTTIDLSAIVSVQENGIQMDGYFTNVYAMNANLTESAHQIAFLDELVENDVQSALVIQYSGGCKAVPGELKLVAQTGNIQISYWAIGPTGLYNSVPKTLTTTAADTIAPVVTFEDDAGVTSAHPYVTSGTDEERRIANTVKIPLFTATDSSGSGVDFSTVKVTVEYQNSSTNKPAVTVYKGAVGEEGEEGYQPADADYGKFYGYFIVNDDGYVNVTYTVSDYTGNEGRASYTIAIGDVQKPIINVDGLNFKESYNLNDELKIDLTKIVVLEPEKESTTLSYSNVTVKVFLDGEDITSSAKLEKSTSTEWYYKLDSVGNYKITFDVSDNAGNSAEQKVISRTISVASTSTTISTTVWGTVLIIVALIVLGGVIYFFIKPSRTKGQIGSGKKSANKKESDKE